MNYETDNNFEYEHETADEGTTEIVPSEPKQPVPKKKKRRKKRYFLKFCIFVAACVGVYFFLHSSVFSAEKIVLAENEYMTKEQVKEITGYKKGVNLFELDIRKNEAKLEEDAYIKEADISRKLPDKVKIVLTLREKTAVIQSDDGFVLIDKENVVVDITEQVPQYTILVGITVEKAEPGQAVEVKETKKYDQYMDFLKDMAKADMFFKKVEIKGKNVTAYATDTLCCTGTVANVTEGMESGNLQAIFYDLMQKGVVSGVINVGDDKYYSFTQQ